MSTVIEDFVSSPGPMRLPLELHDYCCMCICLLMLLNQSDSHWPCLPVNLHLVINRIHPCSLTILKTKKWLILNDITSMSQQNVSLCWPTFIRRSISQICTSCSFNFKDFSWECCTQWLTGSYLGQHTGLFSREVGCGGGGHTHTQNKRKQKKKHRPKHKILQRSDCSSSSVDSGSRFNCATSPGAAEEEGNLQFHEFKLKVPMI